MADEVLATLHRWSDERHSPQEQDLTQALIGEGLDPIRMVEPPCTYFHGRVRNAYETRWMLEGMIEVGFEDQRIEMRAGDRLDLPPNVRHWIRVLSENGAVYLFASRRGCEPVR